MTFLKENKMLFSIAAVCVVILAVIGVVLLTSDFKQPVSPLLEIQPASQDRVDAILLEYEPVGTISIGDVTPPLLIGSSTVTVEVGTECIPGPAICMDDFDKSVTPIVKGWYDLNKVGTYKLTRVATDSTGNSSTLPFTLRVVEELSEAQAIENESPKLHISDAITAYKKENTRIGIDVSKWQGNIDWEKVEQSGVEFVMIRLGIQDGFGGVPTVDSYFLSNYKGAKAVGLDVGVYFYSYSTSVEESVKHALYVVEVLEEYDCELDLPVVYDWESWSLLSSLGLSLNDLNDCANVFLYVVEKFGYEGSLYSSKYYLENGIWNLSQYPLWLAHYTSQTDYEGEFNMWQCSCTGQVPGVYGNVDINVQYIDNRDK